MHRIAIAALFSVALSCAALAQVNTDTCQLTVRVRTTRTGNMTGLFRWSCYRMAGHRYRRRKPMGPGMPIFR